MAQEIICLVAGQRSGTTALRSILGSTGRFHNFQEIFHTEEIDFEGNFFGYCRTNGTLATDMLSVHQIECVAQDFVSTLRQRAGQRHVLMDVKFNSWHAIAPAWSYPHEEPAFLRILKRLKTIFFFIQREDLAAQIASEAIARAADKWHNVTVEDQLAPITLDLTDVRRRARLICLAESFLWNFLKNHPRSLPLIYETLFADDGLQEAAQEKIVSVVGEPLNFPKEVKIQRNNVQKSIVVENYEDVEIAVKEVIAAFKRPVFDSTA